MKGFLSTGGSKEGDAVPAPAAADPPTLLEVPSKVPEDRSTDLPAAARDGEDAILSFC
jgi:hypothetical protein